MNEYREIIEKDNGFIGREYALIEGFNGVTFGIKGS